MDTIGIIILVYSWASLVSFCTLLPKVTRQYPQMNNLNTFCLLFILSLVWFIIIPALLLNKLLD